MNFQAIASAYDSSGSESDEDPSAGVVSTLDSPDKGKEKGQVQADINQGQRARIGNSQDQVPESGSSRTPPTAAQRLPPPPVALLGVNESPKQSLSRNSEGTPQPITKRRKIEHGPQPLPARILLPRQVQTKTPNVPTEDLQSYGISLKKERKPP